MTTVMYTYKPGSKGGKDLANALGIKRLKHEGSKFKPRPNKTLINWGSSNLPDDLLFCKVINAPEAVSKAANKLLAFEAMGQAGVAVPRFTTDPVEAVEWGTDVCIRHKLNGHSGDGLEISPAGQNLADAPLYVEYIKKMQEYRIHVVNGEVADVQRKARKQEVPDDQVNWKIRNHDNGFIFARGELGPLFEARAVAIDAVKALGLDFGAVDLIWNQREDKYYVLEVNTACGLEGTTLDNYVKAFTDAGWV